MDRNNVDRVDNNDDGVAGPVAETTRSNDETTSGDATIEPRIAREETTNPNAAGVPAGDPDAGDERKKAYERGAILVSRID